MKVTLDFRIFFSYPLMKLIEFDVCSAKINKDNRIAALSGPGGYADMVFRKAPAGQWM